MKKVIDTASGLNNVVVILKEDSITESKNKQEQWIIRK